ncbi:MAG: hypothetical protein K2P81_05190 [Bacteriovoracaceae bacterium]|nr:hypothetical protein [Bacteriovoracaceae bacterium]
MIDLPAMSEEAIASEGVEMDQLWMVKLNDEVFGPYETSALKAYAAANPAIMADAEVTTMLSESWQLYLQSPLKPVAKKSAPKLVSAQTLQTHNSYHLERHGHRHGPYTHDQIAKMVKDQELNPIDLISHDEGFTWAKVYQLKEFEARPHQADQLPASPMEETYQRSHAEALEALMKSENPLHEGLASLAYLGQHRNQTSLKIQEVSLPKVKNVSAAKAAPTKTWWIAGGGAATAVLALMIFWSQAPAPEDGELALSDENTESVESGSALLNNNRAPRRFRSPASVRPSNVDSPRTMTDSRRDLMDYRDNHQENYQNIDQPMDADPYAADSQMAQQDAMQNHAPDDGYRLEEPIPGQTGPIIEEVGDF